MIKTVNMTDTVALAMRHAAYAKWAAGLKNGQQQQQGANVEYYRAYYCPLVTKRAERVERNHRLKAIRMGRRKPCRERLLQSLKTLANVLGGGAEAVN